ncbi:MAG: OmpA family protein, partial [Methylococcales bacterium]|nr:OmpA family protein [Methylococcales bacterium]
LAYRVEQAFLIDRNTGLLLRHVSIEGVDELRDSDAVSAMLMAIQDFTQDSFSSNENDQLNTVEVGEYTVFLNRGAYAMLACVIQGIPPYQLRAKFDSILSDIHQHYIDLLQHFEGDSAPLAVIDETLDQCLLSERKNEAQKKIGVSGKYSLIPLLLILILLSYWAYDHWKFEQRRNDYLTLLQQYDGVVVTDNNTDHDKLIIKGLYDPLIVNPYQVLYDSDLQTNEVITDWQAYHSLMPSIVIQRLRKVLQIPPYVTATLTGTVLKLSGVADAEWIENLKTIRPVLTGVTQIGTTALKNYTDVIETELNIPKTAHFHYENGKLQLKGTASIKWYHQATQKTPPLKFIQQVEWHQLTIVEEKKLQLLKEQLEKQMIYFTGDTIKKKNAKILQGVLNLLKKMAGLNQRLAQQMQLTVTGYTDGVDSMEYNKVLAQTRAKTVIDFLKPHLQSIEMQMALQLSHTQRNNKLQRKVGFSVSFNKE